MFTEFLFVAIAMHVYVVRKMDIDKIKGYHTLVSQVILSQVLISWEAGLPRE